jgi:hypothetical protein
MQCVLTLLDTIGIQKYIFTGNRLRENIGASELVERAIKQWAYELLPPRHNVSDKDTGLLDNDIRVDHEGVAAEVIYSGGGNTAILFKDYPAAQRFTQELSVKVLHDAPGLQFAVTHLDVDLKEDSLVAKVKEAIKSLDEKKRLRPAALRHGNLKAIDLSAIELRDARNQSPLIHGYRGIDVEKGKFKGEETIRQLLQVGYQLIDFLIEQNALPADEWQRLQVVLRPYAYDPLALCR